MNVLKWLASMPLGGESKPGKSAWQRAWQEERGGKWFPTNHAVLMGRVFPALRTPGQDVPWWEVLYSQVGGACPPARDLEPKEGGPALQDLQWAARKVRRAWEEAGLDRPISVSEGVWLMSAALPSSRPWAVQPSEDELIKALRENAP
jgi:hypothetical protein